MMTGADEVKIHHHQKTDMIWPNSLQILKTCPARFFQLPTYLLSVKENHLHQCQKFLRVHILLLPLHRFRVLLHRLFLFWLELKRCVQTLRILQLEGGVNQLVIRRVSEDGTNQVELVVCAESETEIKMIIKKQVVKQ